jgi:signal transduction histidine kinase
MKLINKISRKYFVNSLIIFLVMVVVIFYLSGHLITNEIDEGLVDSLKDIKTNLEKDIIASFPPYIEVQQLEAYSKPSTEINDTSFYVKDEKEKELFRQLISYQSISGKNFKITIRNSSIENEDLFVTILTTSLLILLLLILGLFYINKKATVKIFRTFYDNLKKIKTFSIKSEGGLELKESDIDEFKELNDAVLGLSRKAQKEYRSMEEFSQNISHELLTPVAVIKSKIEILLQKEIPEPDTVNSIQVILQNVNKLEKINKSLILLTKLEKIHFESNEVNLKNEIIKISDNFEDIAKSGNIHIEKDFKSDIVLNMNETLLTILLNNLFSNAIKYNIDNGFISIYMEDDVLEIKNSGKESGIDPDRLFERFAKGKEFSDSVGLGLAIVKKICNIYGFRINYSYERGAHLFTLHFNNGI